MCGLTHVGHVVPGIMIFVREYPPVGVPTAGVVLTDEYAVALTDNFGVALTDEQTTQI